MPTPSSDSTVPSTPAEPRTTTARGRAAEAIAAAHLETQGLTILSRNWRNRWCELDIVARQPADPVTGRPAEVHFVEVKYRRTTAYGYAAEYITRDKTARLIRAASAWCQAQAYTGPYQIGVVTVEGALDHPQVAYLAGAIFA
jgi:putative endonuclease